MTDLLIRNATPNDQPAIHALVSAAFGRPAEAELVVAIERDGDAAISLVAEAAGEIVGHVLLSPMSAPFPALALAPLAVAPGRQRQGIGKRLIRAALERARADGWLAVFVLGDPDYYGRFGFSVEAAAAFSSRYAGPHFMMLALNELPIRGGELRHAPAFDEV